MDENAIDPRTGEKINPPLASNPGQMGLEPVPGQPRVPHAPGDLAGLGTISNQPGPQSVPGPAPAEGPLPTSIFPNPAAQAAMAATGAPGAAPAAPPAIPAQAGRTVRMTVIPNKGAPPPDKQYTDLVIPAKPGSAPPPAPQATAAAAGGQNQAMGLRRAPAPPLGTLGVYNGGPEDRFRVAHAGVGLWTQGQELTLFDLRAADVNRLVAHGALVPIQVN